MVCNRKGFVLQLVILMDVSGRPVKIFLYRLIFAYSLIKVTINGFREN